MSDDFYRAFEDRYRGSREIITARLSAYLPFIEPLAALYQPARALDAGCGRGEWLELAAATGFDASGVDLDDGMLAECRARGLHVTTADAIATLRGMPDASLAMVTAFHLVEHIGFDQVRALIGQALRVLQPGGLLIMETPNPENLVVGASSFYRDPSHVRPIPPELLAFASEHAGFARHSVVRLQEAPQLREARELHLQQVLDGVSPDYAVVAQKAAAPELLARFDAAFAASYGLSLEVLAQRYDRLQVERRSALGGQLEHLGGLAAQSAQQSAALRAGMGELGQHVEGALAGIGALDARAGHLEARAGALEARLAAAEAHANAMGQKVIDLMSSTSWKVTEPLRYVGGLWLRLRTAQRNGTILAGLRRRARDAVRRAGQLVLRNARAKRAARAVLVRFPGLQARLREMMYSAPVTPGAPPPADQQPGDLSPRAQRLYEQLKQAKARRGQHKD